MKAVTKKKKVGSAKCTLPKEQPRSTTNIEELKTKLNLILVPDYSHGDYWPKLDRRLCGLLPDLIAQTLDALEARYPTDHATACTSCHHNERTN